MKNTGAPSQIEFEAMLRRQYGKRVFIHRVTDSKEVTGMNKRAAFTKAQPSDYVITADGQMFYAEVKSTTKDRWSLSKIEKGQRAACVQQIAAGGTYWLYIHFVVPNEWYRVPGEYLLAAKEKSWSRDDLKGQRIRS
jgi:penicillin-binding protein-related factor A (putative recombinase)